MDRANYENYIAAFINLSKHAAKARSSKEFIRLVLQMVPLVEGKLTDKNRAAAVELINALLNGSSANGYITAYSLFRLIHTDSNIIKLKDMHAGASEVKVYGEH